MKSIAPADRVKNVRYAIRDVVEAAKELEAQGRKILYLNIGDPPLFDFETPKHLWDAILEHRRVSESYSDSAGIPEAREAVAAHSRKIGVSGATEDKVIITNGISEATLMLLGCLINPGDNVLVPAPGYPLFNSLVSYYGGLENNYFLEEENGWEPDISDLEKKVNGKTKALILINPNNPTGAVYSKSKIKAVLNLAGQHNIPVISDEIYNGLVYDGEPHTPTASISKDVPVLCMDGLSKNYLATGFRMGWIVFHDPTEALADLKESVEKLCRLRLCPCHPMQYAIPAALNSEPRHLAGVREKLRKRRDLAYKRLNEISGLSCVKPKGSFYAFPRIEAPVESDRGFVMELLKEKGVLTVFGSGFGELPGTKHFRIVFLPDEKTLSSAFDRIEEFMKEKFG